MAYKVVGYMIVLANGEPARDSLGRLLLYTDQDKAERVRQKAGANSWKVEPVIRGSAPRQMIRRKEG